MYVCVKQAYQNSATNMKVSIFNPYDINLICTKFGTFTLICTIVPKGWCCPFSVLCLSDASLIIADNCNALCLIPPPAVRSVSTWLISCVNYGDTCCKVLICHSLLLSLDQAFADIRNSCSIKLA